MLQIDWIRHTSLVVEPDLCYGHSDIAVADSFLEEAEVVKAQLAQREYDVVFTSPLSRAAKLCEFCGFSNAVKEPRVMERNFGEWENTYWSDIFALLETPEGQKYLGEHGEFYPPGGESEMELLARVKAFVDEVRASRLRRVAVFCHGGVINSARLFHGDVDLKNLFHLVPPYGSIISLKYAQLDEVAYPVK